jgi:hypothetical protein
MARAEPLAKGNLLGGEIKYVVPKAGPAGRFLFRVLLPVFTPEDEANGFRDFSPEGRVVMVVTVTPEELLDRLLFQKAALSQLGMWHSHGDCDTPRRERDEGWRRMVEEALGVSAPLPGVVQEAAWRAKGILFMEPPVEVPTAPKKRKRRAPADQGAAQLTRDLPYGPRRASPPLPPDVPQPRPGPPG